MRFRPSHFVRLPRLLVATRFGIGVSDLAWLEHRIELLAAVTAPSLASQTNQSFTWAILTDQSLPSEIRKRLDELTAPFESAQVVDAARFPFTNDGFLALAASLSTKGSKGWLLTSRLDDDDAWHRETVERVYAELGEWQRAGRSSCGVGVTFSHVLEWVMYEMLSIPRLSQGRLSTTPAMTRAVTEPFASMSVFVLSRAHTRVSARSVGHQLMREFLTERGYDVRVVETEEPACLYCRHKQINTSIGKGHTDAVEREPDVAQLSHLFGIDEALTKQYLARADEIPYALEKFPNHRRRERAKLLAEIEHELSETDDARRQAELGARRRLLKAEAKRLQATRVSVFDELLAMRDSSAGQLTREEQIAELRGVLAERKRAEAEIQAVLTESEYARVRAERKLGGLQSKVAKLRQQAVRSEENPDILDARDDPLDDIPLRVPDAAVARVFDVGANVGQTVARIRGRFPDADIWAFEPVPGAFDELQAGYGEIARCFNLALGAQNGTAVSQATSTSSINHLLLREPSLGRDDTVTIEVVTGDSFCAEHSVDTIDYLKVDTDGYDLEVLWGFREMLGSGRIGILQVEAGMNVANALHVPLRALETFLEPLGYVFYGFCQHITEEGRGAPLRRTNPVFVDGKRKYSSGHVQLD